MILLGKWAFWAIKCEDLTWECHMVRGVGLPQGWHCPKSEANLHFSNSVLLSNAVALRIPFCSKTILFKAVRLEKGSRTFHLPTMERVLHSWIWGFPALMQI